MLTVSEFKQKVLDSPPLNPDTDPCAVLNTLLGYGNWYFNTEHMPIVTTRDLVVYQADLCFDLLNDSEKNPTKKNKKNGDTNETPFVELDADDYHNHHRFHITGTSITTLTVPFEDAIAQAQVRAIKNALVQLGFEIILGHDTGDKLPSSPNYNKQTNTFPPKTPARTTTVSEELDGDDEPDGIACSNYKRCGNYLEGYFNKKTNKFVNATDQAIQQRGKDGKGKVFCQPCGFENYKRQNPR